MEWFPTVAFTFKFLVLGTGMFFAIKWHYDQGEKGKGRRAMLRAAGKVAVVSLLLLLGLVLGTFAVARRLGLDLTFP
jgi:hypothetical protein